MIKVSGSYALILLILILPGISTIYTANAQLLYKTEKINPDSLELLLPALTSGQKANVLMQLSSLYAIGDSVKCLDYARQALQVANEIADPLLIARSKFVLASAHHFRDDYPNAVSQGLEVIELAKGMNNPLLLFDAISAVFFSYLYSGNYDLANHLVNEVVSSFQEVHDPELKFQIYIAGGWSLFTTGSAEPALPFFRHCTELYYQSGKIPLANFIVLLYQTGYANLSLHRYDSCLHYFRQGKDNLGRQPGLFKIMPSFVADFNDDIAHCYMQMNMPDSAEYYLLQSVEQFKLRGNRDIYEIGANQLDLGRIYRKKAMNDKALACFDAALDAGNWVLENKKLALDDTTSINYWYNPLQNTPLYNVKMGLGISLSALKNLYLIHKEKGNHQKALELLEHYNTKSDVLEAINKQQAVMSLNTRYQTERKEKQIQLLSQQHELDEVKLERTRTILFAFVAVAILTLISAGLLIWQIRTRQEQKNQLLQQRLFRAQLNPHFIFNTLSNIQGLILEKETIQASTYLSHMSKLVRNILQGSTMEFITLAKEVETLEHYMKLQKIRYRESFNYEFRVDETLDQTAIMIPPMLVQPFVENAIEHGLHYKQSKGKLKVEILGQDSFVEFIITDDGIGRARAAELQSERQKYRLSFATQTIQQRINSLNRISRKKYSLEITDLFDADGNSAGTMVRITMPFSQE